MEHLVVDQVSRHGYLAVFVLMVLESACVPVPSEVVMLFGGALAGGLVIAGVHVDLNVMVVALAGAAGNLAGSLVAYAAGRVGGRPLLDRYGRYLFIREKELERSEAFFARRGEVAVFVGRLLPVVRTFISLPAGIAEMPVIRFSVLTVLGSLPWTFALALAGDGLVSHWKTVSHAFVPVSIAIAMVMLAAIGWWLVQQKASVAGSRAEQS